jgi:ABC-type amino acid transport substrate-binding protein
MTDLPDYARSRAILIGTANHRDPGFPALPAADNSLSALRDVLVDGDLCGWPADRVTVLADPTDVSRLSQTLRRLARATDEVLLVYFVGHGVILRRGQLCLVLSDTDAEDPDITGLEFARLRETLLDSPARVKIVVLDCCYSGRAIEALAGEGLADYVDTAGVYTLAASDQVAHVVPLEQQEGNATSFTGELVNLIRTGIPDLEEWLTLGRLYPQLRRRLDRRGLPTPNRRGTDTVDEFPFTRNAAYRPPGETVPPATAQRAAETVPPDKPRPRRRPRLSRRVAASSLLSAVTAGVLASVIAIWGPSSGEQDPPRYSALPSLPVDSPTFKRMNDDKRVVVGVWNDVRGFSTGTEGSYAGFDIEIAKLIAGGLGFDQDEITFKEINSSSREEVIVSEAVDYVVAAYPVTEDRDDLISLAGPYYLGGQDLLVRASETSITGTDTLDGKRVCAVEGTTYLQRLLGLEGIDPGAVVVKQNYLSCLESLRTGESDAVTGDDATLRAQVLRSPDHKIIGEPFAEEPYYIGLPRNDRQLRDAMNEILRRALNDGTWQEIYDEHLGDSGPPPPTPKPR